MSQKRSVRSLADALGISKSTLLKMKEDKLDSEASFAQVHCNKAAFN
jgi:hypothetical protein